MSTNTETELAALRAELAEIKAAVGEIIPGYSIAQHITANLRNRVLIGDLLAEQGAAMQAAIIEWERGVETAKAGQAAMAWLYNTLAGPGHLDFDSAAQTAQEWFDQQIERIEAHRTKHPLPEDPERAMMLGALRTAACALAHASQTNANVNPAYDEVDRVLKACKPAPDDAIYQGTITWLPIAACTKPGRYPVIVATDGGPQLHTLDLDKAGRWIFEGEPTYCQPARFDPVLYGRTVLPPLPPESE